MQKKGKKELMRTCASATKFNSVRKGITIAVEMTLCYMLHVIAPSQNRKNNKIWPTLKTYGTSCSRSK